MANKQTQPGLAQVQGTYVNTNGNPLIPQTNWKSPLREIAKIGEQGVNLAKQYQDIKFDGYQAQYSIMANQMYHEMQDATDPTQLDEIQAKYEQKFAEPLEDNIWARSYLKSQYRQKWDNTMKENSLKVRYAMQHKFNVIETEKTLNSMAMAAASTGDINAMTSYFDSGIALIDSQEMSVDEKNAAKKAYAKFFVNANFNSNPNLTNSFAQQYAGELAPYGVDANEIKTKTDSYNVQQENRLYTKKTRAEKEKKDAAAKIANDATIDFLKTGNLEAFEQKIEEVRGDNPEEALKMYKVAYPDDAKESAKRRAVKGINEALDTYKKDPTEENKTAYLDEVEDARLNLYISDTDTKMFRQQVGISPDGKTNLTEIALTGTAQELEAAIANPENEVSGTQATALRNMQKENSGYNAKERLIREKKGRVPIQTIKSWGFSDAETAKLIEIQQQELKASGSKSAEYEILALAARGAIPLPENARELWNVMPESERKDLMELVKKQQERVHEVKMDNYRNKAVKDPDFNIAFVNDLYAKGDISKTEREELINTVVDRAKKDISTFKASIVGKIANRAYRNEEELLDDAKKLKDMYPENELGNFSGDLDSLINFYNKTDTTIKNKVNSIYATIDKEFGYKDILMSTIDTVTPIRIADMKEVVFNSIMKDYFAKNPDGSPKYSLDEIVSKYNQGYINNLWLGKEVNGVRTGGMRPSRKEISDGLISLTQSGRNTPAPKPAEPQESESSIGKFFDSFLGKDKKKPEKSVVRIEPKKEPEVQGQLINGKMNLIDTGDE